jgi:hypothetical protein
VISEKLYMVSLIRATEWAERRKEELDTGKFQVLLKAIRRQIPRSQEARRCLHYFQTNRGRMRYPTFHAQGLCTSTGVVEAGCKVVIGTRLKRAGMHWTVQGSNAIIALRCAKLRTLSGFLGTQKSTQGRMTHHFFVVHPWRGRSNR